MFKDYETDSVYIELSETYSAHLLSSVKTFNTPFGQFAKLRLLSKMVSEVFVPDVWNTVNIAAVLDFLSFASRINYLSIS